MTVISTYLPGFFLCKNKSANAVGNTREAFKFKGTVSFITCRRALTVPMATAKFETVALSGARNKLRKAT